MASYISFAHASQKVNTSEKATDKHSRTADSSSRASSVASTRASSGRTDSEASLPSFVPAVVGIVRSSKSSSESEACLVARFFELAGVPHDGHDTLESALSTHFNASKTEAKSAASRVLKSVRLLKFCDYERADIELVLAHAAVYLQRSMTEKARRNMNLDEFSFVACLMVYLAHSHVIDEFCPLLCWHKHIFAKYCSIHTLNMALMKLFENLSYKLRVDPEDLKAALLYVGLTNEERDTADSTCSI